MVDVFIILIFLETCNCFEISYFLFSYSFYLKHSIDYSQSNLMEEVGTHFYKPLFTHYAFSKLLFILPWDTFYLFRGTR